MRVRAAILAALVAAAVAARRPLSSEMTADQATATGLPPGTSILFTLLASTADLRVGADPARPDVGTLTLTGVSPRATWFAERPVRAAGVLPTATLATARALVARDETGDDAWLGAPNLAMVGSSAAEGEVTAVLTVRGWPEYDGANRTLTATVDVVPTRVPASNQGAPLAIGGDGYADTDVPGWVADLAAAKFRAAAARAAAARAADPPQSPTARTLALTSVSLFIDQGGADAYLLMPAPSPPPPPAAPAPPPPPPSGGAMQQCLSTMTLGCSPWSGWYPGYGYDYGYYPGGLASSGGYQTGVGLGGGGVAYGGMGMGSGSGLGLDG
jgi:hypothetical protein